MKVLILFITIVAVIGPFDCDGQRTEEKDLAKLTEMEAQIDALIGDARCTDGAECRIIAFGAKPCGGPWKYKIYSESVVSTAQLARYVDAYNGFNRELNERYGWVSTCDVPNTPEVECMDGRCQRAPRP